MARRLSSEHLVKYLKGGTYHDFLQYVKSDNELTFEIRVKDEVTLEHICPYDERPCGGCKMLFRNTS